MKHLKPSNDIHLAIKKLLEKSKLVSNLLTDIYQEEFDGDFCIFRVSELDSSLDLMLEFSGDLNNKTYYKFDQLISILNKIQIKWRFSIGGGYIDISFEDETKIDKLIKNIKTIIQANKYNL